MRLLRFAPVFAVLAVLGILPLAGCSWVEGDRISSDFHATVANAPATLEVDNAVGTITIDAWDKPSVEINATKRGPNFDDVNAIKISVEPSGNTLTVATHYPSGANNLKVDYTIHAPAATALHLVQSVGAITANGFTGDLDEHTSTGGVDTNMASLAGTQHLHIDVSVGGVRLTLPANADAAVTASASVGGIRSDFPLSIQKSMVGQNAAGKIGNGSAVANITVSTGGIAIQRE